MKTTKKKNVLAMNELNIREIIILTMANAHYKAKLGFTRKAADATFYINAKVIAFAIRLNVKGYYSPKFKQLDLLDRQIIAFRKALISVKLGGLGKVGKKDKLKTSIKYSL